MTHQQVSVAWITIHDKLECSFYAAWIGLTFLSVRVAFILDLLLLRLITLLVGDFIYVNGVQHITEDQIGMYTLFPIVGLVTEIVQYGMLRHYLPQMGDLVLVTTVGWVLGLFPIQILLWIQRQEMFNSDLAFLLFGLFIGGGQWLLRRHLPRAGW